MAMPTTRAHAPLVLLVLLVLGFPAALATSINSTVARVGNIEPLGQLCFGTRKSRFIHCTVVELDVLDRADVAHPVWPVWELWQSIPSRVVGGVILPRKSISLRHPSSNAIPLQSILWHAFLRSPCHLFSPLSSHV